MGGLGQAQAFETGRRVFPAICRSPRDLALFMGYALLGVWMGQSGATGIVPVKAGTMSFTATALVFEIAAMVVVALLARRVASLRSSVPVYWFALALMVATPIAWSLAGMGLVAGGPTAAAVGVACGAVCGVARALAFLMWVDAFALLGPQSLCVCFTGASLARIVLSVAVEPLSHPVVSCVLACAAGVASMVMCRRCAYSDGPARDAATLGEGLAEGLPRTRFPWRPIVLMLVYYPAFCLVLVSVGTANPVHGIQEVGGVLAYVAVLVLAVLAFRRFRLSPLYGVALPCMCAALLGIMGSVAWPTDLVLFLAGVGFHCLYLFVYLLLFTIAFRYGVSTAWLVGLTTAPRVAVKGLAGILFSTTGLSVEGVLLDQTVAVLVVALIVASLVLASGREYGSTWGIVEGDGDVTASRGPGSLVDRCRDLARLHGLTRREEDVLILLAGGSDVSAIGERLVLSKGTVRNHVQHVYRKFDVHSREELVSRVRET